MAQRTDEEGWLSDRRRRRRRLTLSMSGLRGSGVNTSEVRAAADRTGSTSSSALHTRTESARQPRLRTGSRASLLRLSLREVGQWSRPAPSSRPRAASTPGDADRARADPAAVGRPHQHPGPDRRTSRMAIAGLHSTGTVRSPVRKAGGSVRGSRAILGGRLRRRTWSASRCRARLGDRA